MASTRKPPSAIDASADGVIASVRSVLEQYVRPGQGVCAALSGGVDSVVLLDCLARLRPLLGFRLTAVHVNHGLSPDAASWAAFCRRHCTRRGIPLAVHAVQVRRGSGESLEARAREARYGVLQGQDADFVALGHNLDDQAETLLLQLLRGAGLKGLAAMPVLRDRGPNPSHFPRLLRPLIGVSRAEIERHGHRRRLSWVEDESNADTRFDRNYLRRRVMPLLERRFPGYRETLGRTSRHLAEAMAVVDALAAADAERAQEGEGVRIPVLRELGAARAKNLLRHLMEGRGAPMPPDASLEEGLRQLLTAGPDAKLRIPLGALLLRRRRGLAFLEPALPPPPLDLALPWRGEAELDLGPGLGRLGFRRARGRGLSAERLGTEGVTVRLRKGGECLRPDSRRPRRTLKNLLQETGVPHWQRERLPLLFRGDALVWVPGIGADATYRCPPGERGIEIVWDPRG